MDLKGSETFHATVQFQNKDVEILKARLPVALKVYAFRFTKCCIIDGVLGEINLEFNSNDSQPVFKGQANALESNIRANDELVRLKSGMTLSAEVKMGGRQVIDYLLPPLKKKVLSSFNEV